MLVAAALLLVVPGAQAAHADTAPAAGTPATVSADGLPTVQINGVVWQQALVGDTVYAGGEFSNARPAGAAAGVNTVPALEPALVRRARPACSTRRGHRTRTRRCAPS